MKFSIQRVSVAFVGAAAVAVLAPAPMAFAEGGLPLVPFQAEQVTPEQQKLQDIEDYECRYVGREIHCRPSSAS